MADAEIEPLLPRLRAAISNAYYDARNDGRTMEQAADVAATGCEAVVKAWLADYAAKDAPSAENDALREAVENLRHVIDQADTGWQLPRDVVRALHAAADRIERIIPPEKGGADA